MWFKNLTIFRLPKTRLDAATMTASLEKMQFGAGGSSIEMSHSGWAPPCEGGQLVHAVNGQFLLNLRTEKKLLPSSVINEFTKIKCAEIEEQQGYKPGKKQRKDIKEQVTDELLPRAFSVKSSTLVWIDPKNGWVALDTTSNARADDVFKYLLKSIADFPVAALRVERAPGEAMTSWLELDEAPAGFTIDQDTELKATGETKATVRYVSHTLEADDLRRHIKGGKRCTKLALTWNDRVSFILTDTLAIKRVAPLDVLKENSSANAGDDQARFDGDFALMAGELNGLLADLVAALGGESVETTKS